MRRLQAAARAAGLLLAASLTWGPPASAQSPSDGSRAEEFHTEGVQIIKDPKSSTADLCRAVDLFQQSYALNPTPSTLINVAVAEDKCGKLVEAQATLLRFIDENEGNPKLAARIAQVRAFLATLDNKIPRVRVELVGFLEGDVLKLDGQELDPKAASEYVLVNPGEHELTVDRATGLAKREKFSLGIGEPRTVTLEVPPPCPDADHDNRCDEPCVDRDLDGKCDRDSCKDWDEAKQVCRDEGAGAGGDDSSLFEKPLFWIVTGVVVAGLAVGGYFLIDGMSSTEKPAKDDFGGPFKPSASGLRMAGF